jgi:hypothetical protein
VVLLLWYSYCCFCVAFCGILCCLCCHYCWLLLLALIVVAFLFIRYIDGFILLLSYCCCLHNTLPSLLLLSYCCCFISLRWLLIVLAFLLFGGSVDC